MQGAFPGAGRLGWRWGDAELRLGRKHLHTAGLPLLWLLGTGRWHRMAGLAWRMCGRLGEWCGCVPGASVWLTPNIIYV